jgi:hypothetical protein
MQGTLAQRVQQDQQDHKGFQDLLVRQARKDLLAQLVHKARKGLRVTPATQVQQAPLVHKVQQVQRVRKGRRESKGIRGTRVLLGPQVRLVPLAQVFQRVALSARF